MQLILVVSILLQLSAMVLLPKTLDTYGYILEAEQLADSLMWVQLLDHRDHKEFKEDKELRESREHKELRV